MKSLVRLLAICWLVCSGAREQALSQFVIETAGARPDSLQKSFRVDFAIPDAPAFTLLGSEPSNILRPTTVREFSVAFSDFVSNGSSLTIPRTFGVEFSPGLIISGPKLSLTDYRKLDWLYRLRVSAATQRNGNGNSSTDMALGVRTSVIDESDLRNDDAYVARATQIASAINAIYTQARMRTGPPPNPIVLTQDEVKQVEELNNDLKSQWAEEKWNKTVLDVAIGVKGSSPDSTGNGFRTTSIAGWASYSLGLGTWGQALLGGKFSGERADTTNTFLFSGSLAARLYFGGNTFKGFVECQYSKIEKMAYTVFANTGAEAHVWKGTWVVFSGGLEYVQNQRHPVLTTSMKISLGLADLIGL